MSLPTPQNDLARGALSTIAALGESERYWRINAFEALWEGLYSDGRPSFWDTSVPLRERAPVVQSFLARTCGRRLASLVFGERSFPSIALKAKSYGGALTDDERATINGLLDELVEAASLRTKIKEHLLQGLKTGSVCALFCLRDGLPAVDLIPAKWCTPDLSPSGAVRSLVIEWQTMAVEDGQVVQYKHRREITDTEDKTFAVVKNEGKPIEWSRVSAVATYPLEFCTVDWTRNDPDATDGASIDGYPLAYGLEDEIAALDLELSQGHRNALYNGEPQMVRVGVDGDAPPMGPQGRTAAPTDERFSWLNSAAGSMRGWLTGSAAPAVKKAPGSIWNLPTGGDAKLLESTGSGMQIITTAQGTLRRTILDAVGVVLADPDALGKGDLSSKALHLMHAPMLDVSDNLREVYGRALCRILDGLLRLCQTAAARASGVTLPSWEAALPILASRNRERVDKSIAWQPLPLGLTWGEYFEPSWSDVTSAVTAAKAGVEAGILSRVHAVKMLAPLVGVVDVAAEIDAITGDSRDSSDAVRSVVGALDAPTLDPATEVVPADTAMNGAQVAALVAIVEAVVKGTIPRDSAVQIIAAAFSLTPGAADTLLGPAGRGFVAVPVTVEPTFHG